MAPRWLLPTVATAAVVAIAIVMAQVLIYSRRVEEEFDLEEFGAASWFQMSLERIAQDAISSLVFGAILVGHQVGTPLSPCNLPSQTASTFDLTPLLGVYNSFTELGRSIVQGLGVITAENVDTGFNTSVIDLGNKISFELTNGSIVYPPCPTLLFGFTDIGATYSSYCVSSQNGSIDYAGGVKYSGPDSGLTEPERLIMNGTEKAYISHVFDLVGRQSISFELPMYCGPSPITPYGIAFAQTNLELLSADIARRYESSEDYRDRIGFVVDREGFMIADSIGDQTVYDEPNAWGGTKQIRYAAVNVSDPLMRLAAQSIVDRFGSFSSVTEGKDFFSKDGTVVISVRGHFTRTVLEGLAPPPWLTVVAFTRKSYVSKVSQTGDKPLLAGMIVLSSVMVISFAVWMYKRGGTAPPQAREVAMQRLNE